MTPPTSDTSMSKTAAEQEEGGIDDGGPAFPQHDLSGYGMGPSTRGKRGDEPDDFGNARYTVEGMSTRDYFAAQLASGAAFQARFPTIWDQDADWLKKQKLAEIHDMSSKIAVVAYAMADAMLRARHPSLPEQGEQNT